MTQKYSALIVDSNPEELMPLICFLEDSYELHVAPEEGDYMGYAQTCCPDIILIDDMVTEPNCYDACQEWKATAGTNDVPIVLMSDLEDDELNREIDYLGVDDFIRKPFDKSELLEKINTLISFRHTDE